MKPSPRQLEFLDWEFGVFFHFGTSPCSASFKLFLFAVTQRRVIRQIDLSVVQPSVL